MTVSILYADAMTCLGCGEALFQSLLAGKSGLRPATEAFPNTSGIEHGGQVGVLADVLGNQRVPKIFELAFGKIVPDIFFESEMVIGACSLGDLTGEHAGNPRLALMQQLRLHWPKRKIFPPTTLISNACSSGTDALIMATQAVQSGLADIVSVIAFDSLEPGKLIQHIALGTQSRDRAKPFDANRNGTSFGEGLAVIIVASDQGRARLGWNAIASVAGFGMTCDAYDIAAPFPDGQYAARAISAAIAAVNINTVGYINAHGSGTPLNDAAECAALHRALGAGAQHVNVGSTKGALGHTLGATGLVESVVAVNSLRANIYPPTAGLQELDPTLALNVLKQATLRDCSHEYVLSVTFGFGGVNSAVLLGAVSCLQKT